MKDNFDLKKFLVENNLTAGSRQLKEDVSDDVWDRLDTAIANDDDEALKAIALELLGKAGNWAKEKVSQGADWMKQKLMKAHGITDDDLNEGFNPKSKLAEIIAQAWAEKDLDKAKQIIRDLIEPSRIKAKEDILTKMEPINNKKEFDRYLANSLLKFEGLGLNEAETTEPEEKDNELKADPTVFSKNENKMTSREKMLVNLVQEALERPIKRYAVHKGDPLANRPVNGVLNHPDDYKHMMKGPEDKPFEGSPNDLRNMFTNQGAGKKPFIPEAADDEMVQDSVLPEYNTIEELMKDIEEGTSKTALEYRMKRTKELYEALDEQLKSLEEGEHAKHIDKGHKRKMRQDSAKLRRYEAKLIKEYERKYNKKATKKATPKKEEVPMEEIAINESKGFDLKKFLVENKLTTNSRILKENEFQEPSGTYSDEKPNYIVTLKFDYFDEESNRTIPNQQQHIEVIANSEEEAIEQAKMKLDDRFHHPDQQDIFTNIRVVEVEELESN